VTTLAVVLDDDLRDLIRSMLERSDHQVISAADEAEAVNHASSTQIDVVLIEVAPSMDGRSVAAALRVQTPGLPVVYISCWFDHPDFVGLKGESILKAPFSREELARAIDAAVANAA
jgi:DNA-binding response OmpR family regulator